MKYKRFGEIFLNNKWFLIRKMEYSVSLAIFEIHILWETEEDLEWLKEFSSAKIVDCRFHDLPGVFKLSHKNAYNVSKRWYAIPNEPNIFGNYAVFGIKYFENV